MTTLTTMTDCSVEPMTADLDGWKVIAGNPGMKTWIEYTSPDESMITGCWEATPAPTMPPTPVGSLSILLKVKRSSPPMAASPKPSKPAMR